MGGVFLLLLTFSLSAAAQNITVRGTIIDELGESVIGATVQISGTTQGAVSDINGNFTLLAPADATLIISFVGYITQEVPVSENIRIALVPDAELLDEVVVIGFGEQRRSAFTGAASVVTADAIALRPVTNVMAAIEGMSAGIQVQTSSSAPGSEPSFRIRGVSSISAGRSPLIVVDGVPQDGGLNDINPNDVESITILKDAASIAIYGARGGNGVILVTTRRPRRGEAVSVTLNSRIAMSRIRMNDMYDVIRSPGEFYERHYAAMYNHFRNLGFNSFEANREANAVWLGNSDVGGIGYMVFTVPDGQLLIGQNGRINPNATLGNRVRGISGNEYFLTPDCWIENTFGSGWRQEHNLTVRGGGENMTLLLSAGYTKEEGITRYSDFERFTGRLRGSFDATSWLRLNANINVSVSSQNHEPAGTGNTIFNNAVRMAPIFPIFIRDIHGNILYNEHGRVFDYGDGVFNDGILRPINTGSNRLQEVQLQTNHTASARFAAQLGTEIRFTPNLSLTLNQSYDERNRRFRQTGQPFYGTSNPSGFVSINHRREPTLNLQHIINYSRMFNDHSFRAVLLHEFFRTDFLSLTGRRDNMFSFFENQELSGAVTIVNANSFSRPYQNEGFGGRIMYNFREIYHIDASYRRDASTRFHPEHRWGNFFSFGAGYVISREDFFNVPWIDQLKLKASFGQNGNDQIGDTFSRFQDAFVIEGIDGEIALTFHERGNRYITWETRTAVNTGIEFSLLNRRLSGGIDFYNNITSNMLSSVSVPSSLGYSSFWANVGNMRNRGVEITLNGDIIRNRDFHWSMYVNTSFNRNQIIELAPERTGETLLNFDGSVAAIGYSSGTFFMGEGMEFRTWRLRRFAGIDEMGRPTWYRLDEQTGEMSTTITWSDGTFFNTGSSQPTMVGGFGGNVGWQGLQLNFAFAFRIGGYALDRGYMDLMRTPDTSRTGNNFHRDTYRSWTPENPSNRYARWMFDDRSLFTNASDRWLERADFLAFQNISLSYMVPRSLLQPLGVESMAVSIGVDNPFILTARRGFIPTRDFDGNLDFGYYPEMTRYMLNISLGF